MNPPSNRWPALATWCLPPCVVLITVWLGLGGLEWEARAPVAHASDALFYLAQTKSTLDHGWWWWNPSLGAPLGLNALPFAQNTNARRFYERQGFVEVERESENMWKLEAIKYKWVRQKSAA